MSEFLIPYAVSGDAQRIGPSEASKSERFNCPDCGNAVAARAGLENGKRRRHFYHIVPQSQCGFSGEGALHLSAKHAVLKAVLDWRDGLGPAPKIGRNCPGCRIARYDSLPISVRDARIEFRIKRREAVIVADVALLNRAAQALCVIEIRQSHAVGHEKSIHLMGLPWIELDAESAINNPVVWTPINGGNLKSVARCEKCLEVQRVQRERKAERHAEEKMIHQGFHDLQASFSEAVSPACKKAHLTRLAPDIAEARRVIKLHQRAVVDFHAQIVRLFGISGWPYPMPKVFARIRKLSFDKSPEMDGLERKIRAEKMKREGQTSIQSLSIGHARGTR